MAETFVSDLAARALLALEAQHLRRSLEPFPVSQGSVVDFSSNDYLGLRTHPLMVAGAVQWVQEFGVGSGASRIAGGTKAAYLAIEDKLARFKKREAALMFTSGYQLNVCVIPALIELINGEVFADRLIHRSLHDGVRLAGKRQNRFRHNDLDHLEDLLKRSDGKSRPLIMTESVFSMDGDLAPLAAMAAMAVKYDAVLYIDEAHATGVFGESGEGLASDLPGAVIVMGTLGKAMGAFGAYLAADRPVIDYLVNKASGFVYSTALPPAVFGAVDTALDLVPQMQGERAWLRQASRDLRGLLDRKGLNGLASESQIVPVLCGDAQHAMQKRQVLAARGINIPAIRPPTVPAGSARLRISLRANHQGEDFARLQAAIGEWV